MMTAIEDEINDALKSVFKRGTEARSYRMSQSASHYDERREIMEMVRAYGRECYSQGLGAGLHL